MKEEIQGNQKVLLEVFENNTGRYLTKSSYEKMKNIPIEDVIECIKQYPKYARILLEKRSGVTLKLLGGRDFRKEIARNTKFAEEIQNGNVDAALINKIVEADLKGAVGIAAKDMKAVNLQGLKELMPREARPLREEHTAALAEFVQAKLISDLGKATVRKIYELTSNLKTKDIVELMVSHPKIADVFLKERNVFERKQAGALYLNFRAEMKKDPTLLNYINNNRIQDDKLLQKIIKANLSPEITAAAKTAYLNFRSRSEELLDSTEPQNSQTEQLEEVAGLFGNSEPFSHVTEAAAALPIPIAETENEKANQIILLDLAESNPDKDPYDNSGNRLKIKDIPIEDIVKFMCAHPKYAGPFLVDRSKKELIERQQYVRDFRKELLLEPLLVNKLRAVPDLRDLLEKSKLLKLHDKYTSGIEELWKIKDEVLREKIINKYKQGVALNFKTPNLGTLRVYVAYLNDPKFEKYDKYLQALLKENEKVPGVAGVMRLFNITQKEFDRAKKAVNPDKAQEKFSLKQIIQKFKK